MNTRIVAGLMSGTSLDGIDAVLIRVRRKGARVRFQQLAYLEVPFPRGLKELILRNSDPSTSRVDDIARLNFLLAELYAHAVKRVARRAGVGLSRINLIGSHGQTIHHLPKPRRMFGKTVRGTLQIGDPSVLATITGIPTIGDFRVADMAVGGQGAPLVPYVDWLLFRSNSRSRMLLNIGGIANVTVLPKGCSQSQVTAFDTGPGNMVVDRLMKRMFKKEYDRDGLVASKGQLKAELLKWMMSHPYLRSKPPKSTGREMFGDGFVNVLLRKAGKAKPEDIIATASFFTPISVFESYRRYIALKGPIDELIVSGGGSHNAFFIEVLESLFGRKMLRNLGDLGVSPDAKEAVCFALLANETLEGRPTNIPGVTGAGRRVVLGKICDPSIRGGLKG